MAQIAKTLSNGQELYINSSDTSTSGFVLNLESTFKTNVAIKSFLIADGEFRYNNRFRIAFRLANHLENHFALIKGLIDFHRRKDFIFTFNRVEKSIEVEVALVHEESLAQFLEEVYASLERELKFKAALKQVIAFEKKLKEESRSVYNALFTA
jgi:hypothetical protein